MSSIFVGRAGDKLDFALKHFSIDVHHLVCADFGAAVGGFTDCLLQNGATKVYSVETGYGVLDWKLRKDERVVVLERSNAMHIILPEKVDLITVDTSWTKQELVMGNVIKNLKDNGQIISLIKPHYEADRSLLFRGKLADDLSEKTAYEVAESLKKFNLDLIGIIKSPLLGSKGDNTEYLAYFRINSR